MASERTQFYKIILDDTISENKLVLPRNFVRNYRHHLSSRVTLKVPSGAQWQVEIVRSGGKMWFQDGWKEFADYYSIKYASFLVFEYEVKNGDFNVTIFDKTATGIDYPFGDEPNIVDEAEDDDVSVEILEHFSPSRTAKEKSPISGKEPNVNVNEEESDDDVEFLDHFLPSFDKGCSSRKQKLPMSKSSQSKKSTSMNLFFEIVLSSRHLEHRVVNVPRNFMRNIGRETKMVTLKVNNRLWPVKLLTYPQFRTEFSAGWSAFAKDNALKLGDVCAFKPSNDSDEGLLMDVSITRSRSSH